MCNLKMDIIIVQKHVAVLYVENTLYSTNIYTYIYTYIYI